MVRRIRRRRGLPRLRREACSYHPQPLTLPLSHEGWLSIFLRRILLDLVFFGAIRGSIISRAGIAVSAVAGFRAAPLTPAFWLFFRGVILRCSIAISIFWSVHHIYVI